MLCDLNLNTRQIKIEKIKKSHQKTIDENGKQLEEIKLEF